MNIVTVLLFLTGLGMLIAGADSLVRGASRLASSMGISSLVIGLTVVAFGTSAPELIVSATASLTGRPGIALGNAIGSNIFNILVILGVSALIAPLGIVKRLLRVDVPIMVGVSVLVAIAGASGAISRLEGSLMVVGIATYAAIQIWASRRENPLPLPPPSGFAGKTAGEAWKSNSISAGMVLVGLTLLTIGARVLVDSTVKIAGWLGVSETIVGLTVVAMGTSLPELATSVVASLRGERDIAVGNIVGSNIFNVLAVLGLAAAVSPTGMPIPADAMHFDIPVMIAVSFSCLPIFFTGYTISRWEGVLFLGYYAAYVTYLVLEVAYRGSVPTFVHAVRGFAIPLTVIVLVLALGRQLMGRSRPARLPR